MRCMAIDYGEKRVGLALSEERGELALPWKTLEYRGDAATAAAIVAEASSAAVTTLVLGLPLSLNGSEGTAALRVRRLGAAIAARAAMPIVYWDERFTTAAAQRSLQQMEVRGKRQRQVVDQVAAALLLQSYLDAQRVPTSLRNAHVDDTVVDDTVVDDTVVEEPETPCQPHRILSDPLHVDDVDLSTPPAPSSARRGHPAGPRRDRDERRRSAKAAARRR